MPYDLDKLQRDCDAPGFTATRESVDALKVTIREGVTLAFLNLVEESDTLIGFEGTQWHTHGNMILMLDQANYVKLRECELLTGIMDGDIVIVERFVDAQPEDRLVAHKLEPFDIEYIEPGEERRIRRLRQHGLCSA